MIRSVRCNQPTFKTVEFRKGFNVVLAERTRESTKKDSRNGLGKTILLEIIHFCLGGKAVKGKGLLRKPLQGWTFALDIELGGLELTILRNTEIPGRVVIEGDLSNWPIRPRKDSRTGETYFPIRQWNTLLGWLIFDLPVSDTVNKYSPTFRSLISYFARKGRDAFSTPFEHHRRQLDRDKQIHNSFLLGINWEDARKWALLKVRDKALKQLKKVADSGLRSNLLGTTGELETTKVHLEEQLARERKQLDGFKVHPQYRKIEVKANSLTSAIHKLVNRNVADRRMVEFYESSLSDEKPASHGDVSIVYKQAGIDLPGSVVRRLEDVENFHERVIENRRGFLESEIRRLNRKIIEREEKIHSESEERSSLLSILKT